MDSLLVHRKMQCHLPAEITHRPSLRPTFDERRIRILVRFSGFTMNPLPWPVNGFVMYRIIRSVYPAFDNREGEFVRWKCAGVAQVVRAAVS